MAKQHTTNPLLICIILFHAWLLAGAQPKPCAFIFGDSLIDVGTNNYLPGALATANQPWYGVDFPNNTATGRFSNAYNLADFIVNLTGIGTKSPPPFLKLVRNEADFRTKIQQGVSFASGGAGILNDTGFKSFIRVIPLAQQLQQFQTVSRNLTQALGAAKAAALINTSLYLISIGSNDLTEYFKFPSPNTSVHQFIQKLMAAYAKRLKSLYDAGARKFGIIGIPPIGSSPMSRSMNGGVCNEIMNEAARSFQASTLTLLQNFSSTNPGVHYSLGDFYGITMSAINNPSAHGFKNVEDACCGVGPNNGLMLCRKPLSKLCPRRDEYLYFDFVHPTQKAAKIAAQFLVNTGNNFAKPIHFGELVKM
nr:GDSL esterase/lipase At5g33370-like [Ipomoea batatas]GMD51503.1 GDSL esterase/lipase At5g33370-like [Ipomoea batatas]